MKTDYRDALTKEQLFLIKARPMDLEIYKRIKGRWDGISKPLDGLGDFEEVICRIGGISGKEDPSIEKRSAVIFCADNGIVGRGVSQVGKEVTLQVARMLGQGISTASTLAKKVGAEVLPIDIGIDTDEEIPGVENLKVRRGTEDFLEGRAMTESEALMAIGTGMDIACELSESGTGIILAGEMGIGNTTTSSALLSLITGDDSAEAIGRGAGLDDEGLKRKKAVIKKAISKYKAEGTYKDEKERAFDLLCSVGGLDIAALCGLFIGGNLKGIPVVMDGLITAVAALVSDIFVPGVSQSVIPSHAGREKGLKKVLEVLELKPFIEGNMALGEGTGALMLLPLIDVALDFYKNAYTFSAGGIEEYKRFI